jgi:hypothetical protein
MRWSLISMIAYTILAVTTARSRAVIPASAEAKLIPLTAAHEWTVTDMATDWSTVHP